MIGLAGESGPGLLFAEWLKAEHGERKNEIREQLRSADIDFTAVMCYPDGSVFEFDKWCIPVEITAPFYTCGNGSKLALGAMKAGAAAAQAVLIACEYDPYTAEPVTWETFHIEGVK